MATRDFPPWLRGVSLDSEGVQNLLSALFDRQNIDLQQELTSVASGDEIGIFDVSETGQVKFKKITRANFLAGQINALLDISGASGGQIKFPATQNPSSDANTLDDYEEGTWTMTDASGAGLSFTGVSCLYVKIGSRVIAEGTATYPVTASGAAALIGGLPFTVTATSGGRQGTVTYSNSATPLGRTLPASSGTTAAFATPAGAGITNANLSGTVNFLQYIYQVD